MVERCQNCKNGSVHFSNTAEMLESSAFEFLQMITRAEESPAIVELVLAQKLFSSLFSEGKINSNHLGHCSTDITANNNSTSSQSSDFIDLSNCMKETEVTIPTLNGFSVPYELSLEGSDEPWAQAFLAHMQAGLKKCDQVWSSLRMEVVGCYPQAIAF
nr:uncharacterized protein LOC109161605 [Ipomoea trifida]